MIIFLQKLDFCYLVGYPHLKLASALSVDGQNLLPTLIVLSQLWLLHTKNQLVSLGNIFYKACLFDVIAKLVLILANQKAQIWEISF